MWRRHSEEDSDPFGRALVDECEWYLSGAFAEHCAADEQVPAWAWMNLLAHGEESELRALATDRAVDDEGRQALRYVAAELLDLAADGYLDLAMYQRDVLVPLELDMFACPTFREWSAAQLASGLLTLLPA